MKTILRYFWYQEKYNLHRTVNGFFYYLRKLPLVGQSIPESIFKSYSFKSALFLLLISLTALFSSISSLFPVAFLSRVCGWP